MAFFNTKFESAVLPETIVAGEQKYTVQPFINNEEVSLFESINSDQPSIDLYWTNPNGAATAPRVLSGPYVATGINTRVPAVPDGSVNCFYTDANHIFIGGKFTKFNTIPSSMFGVLNIDDLQIKQNVLAICGETRPEGSINCITKWKNFLVIGGDYEGDITKGSYMGRGLTIVDVDANKVYPFYVNGIVNVVAVNNDGDLLVGGSFNFINYTSQRASEVTDLRVYSNGLIKVNLNLLENFSYLSIDRDFSNTFVNSIEQTDPINITSIVAHNEFFVVGGSFKLKTNSNLTIINKYGNSLKWNCLFNGEIRSIKINGNLLYVGGEFDFYADQATYEPTNIKTYENVSNLVRFLIRDNEILLDNTWLPEVNGSVDCIFLDKEVVYISGKFTSVNDFSQGHLAALSSRDASLLDWNFSLQSGTLNTTGEAFAIMYDKILVGGTFLQCNLQDRAYLAILPLADINVPVKTDALIKFSASPYPSGVSLAKKVVYTQQKNIRKGEPLTINTSTFNFDNPHLNGCAPGTLVKFTFQLETAQQPIQLLGWRLNS